VNAAPETGLRGTARLRVGAEHTAQALGSGSVPVFSTPMLVALLEQAAVHALEGRLQQGETSVGTRMEVSHLAATPVGRMVTAEAELVEVEGRRLTFVVVASDGVQRIAEGRHSRAVVNEERFLQKLKDA
jgi:fluoroacetyl-CoA thioesterase